MAKLNIEVADTPASLAHGLMYRRDLQKDAGMLFKFPSAINATFWGKNTYIPLDIAFVGPDNKITSIKHIAPMSTHVIHSEHLCQFAIEANAGFFKENNIQPGHRIKLENGTVEFEAC